MNEHAAQGKRRNASECNNGDVGLWLEEKQMAGLAGELVTGQLSAYHGLFHGASQCLTVGLFPPPRLTRFVSQW